jgi:predicted PurR-regulated permease PerM
MLRKLEEIRNADHKTRVRWVAILSTLTSIVVIFIWILSLNILTAQINSAPAYLPKDPEAATLGEKVKGAFGELKLRTGNAVDFFKEAVKSKDIELQASTTQPKTTK